MRSSGNIEGYYYLIYIKRRAGLTRKQAREAQSEAAGATE